MFVLISAVFTDDSFWSAQNKFSILSCTQLLRQKTDQNVNLFVWWVWYTICKWILFAWKMSCGQIWSACVEALLISRLCLASPSVLRCLQLRQRSLHFWKSKTNIERKVKGGGKRESESKNWIPMQARAYLKRKEQAYSIAEVSRYKSQIQYHRSLDTRIYKTDIHFWAVLGSRDCREKKIKLP